MKVGRPFFCGEFDERIKPAKSFYGSHAIARTFLEMLAPVVQEVKSGFCDLRNSRKRQSISRETCGSTRKRQGKRRETCGTPANAKAFPVGLAELPRGISKSTLATYSARSKAFSRDKKPLSFV